MQNKNISQPNLKKHLNAIKHLEESIPKTQANLNKLEEEIANITAKLPEYEKQLADSKGGNNPDKTVAIENTMKYYKEEITARNAKVNNLNINLKTFKESLEKHKTILEKHNSVGLTVTENKQSPTTNNDLIPKIATNNATETHKTNNDNSVKKINVIETYIERAITQLNNIDS